MIHIQARKRKFTVSVDIPVDYGRPVAAKSISKTFPTKTAAKQWGQHVATQIKLGTWSDPRVEAKLSPGRWEARPLRDTLERYRLEVTARKDARGETLRKEAALLQRLGRTNLATKPMNEIGRGDIAEYRDERLGVGRAPQTVRNELNTLSAVWQYAIHDWEYVGLINPVRALTARRGALPKSRPPRDRRLRDGEQAAMEAALAASPAGTDMLLLFRLLLDTGMRLGEVLRLDAASVRRAEHQRVRGLLLEKTKNGDDRTVLVSKPVWSLLLEHCEGLSDNEPLIGLSVDAVEYRWGMAREAAGAHDLRIHDLRHEALSRMAARKCGLDILMAQSGHKDVKTLMRYLNPSLDERRQALFGDEDENEPHGLEPEIRSCTTPSVAAS